MKGIFVIAAMTVSYAAQAVVIDFQSLEVTNGWAADVADGYTEDGFRFNSSNHPGESNAFAVWATDNSSGYYPGSTALFNNFDSSVTIMTQVGGGAFNVGSIQLCNVFRNTTTQTIRFTGTRADATQVFNSISLTDPANMNTFSFSGMTNIVKLEWAQNSPYNQFDNIDTNIVPEPATLSALAIGGLALLRRRRK